MVWLCWRYLDLRKRSAHSFHLANVRMYLLTVESTLKCINSSGTAAANFLSSSCCISWYSSKPVAKIAIQPSMKQLFAHTYTSTNISPHMQAHTYTCPCVRTRVHMHTHPHTHCSLQTFPSLHFPHAHLWSLSSFWVSLSFHLSQWYTLVIYWV